VPSALRDTIDGPSVAWYIRSFEIWGLRQGWHRWKGWNLDERPYDEFISDSEDEGNAALERFHDHTNLDSAFYSESEYALLSKLLREVLHLGPIQVSRCERNLRLGYDEPLKVLLIVLCPKLTKLTFMTDDTGNQTVAPQYYPFALLRRSIQGLMLDKVAHSQWPIGFQSLREVTVGKFTEYCHAANAFYPSYKAIAPLLLFPNLTRLDLNLGINGTVESDLDGVCQDESARRDTNDELSACDKDGRPNTTSDFRPNSRNTALGDLSSSACSSADSDVYIFEWGRKVSSVRELRLDIYGTGNRTICSFTRACKALRKFQTTLSSQMKLGTRIFDALTEHMASLESLALFKIAIDDGRMLDPRLAQFERLVYLHIQACHLINHRFANPTYGLLDGSILGDTTQSETQGNLTGEGRWLDLKKCLPQNLECLRIY
jgi:hypothetical protein